MRFGLEYIRWNIYLIINGCIEKVVFLINLKYKKWNWFYKKSIYFGNLLIIMFFEINIYIGIFYKIIKLFKMLKEYIIRDIF